MGVRVTQATVEALVEGTPFVRITQEAVEALVTPDLDFVNLRLSQLAVEALVSDKGALLGESTVVASAVTNVVLTVPSNSKGKTLVAQVAFRGGTGVTIDEPDGWNLAGRVDNGTAVGMAVYWRKADAESEPATYTWTLSSAQEAGGGISAYEGLSATNPIEVFQPATATGTTVEIPAVETTTRVPRVVVLAAGNESSDQYDEWTPPSGFTETRDRSTTTATATDRITVTKADKGHTGGSTGVVNAAAKSGNPKVAAIVALRDASGVGRADSIFIQ